MLEAVFLIISECLKFNNCNVANLIASRSSLHKTQILFQRTNVQVHFKT